MTVLLQTLACGKLNPLFPQETVKLENEQDKERKKHKECHRIKRKNGNDGGWLVNVHFNGIQLI